MGVMEVLADVQLYCLPCLPLEELYQNSCQASPSGILLTLQPACRSLCAYSQSVSNPQPGYDDAYLGCR
jgi:hypothetical protein